jgi:hypothetical protein
MKPLVETLVREELLAREARSLGLDRDDTIVRRRLAQKLAFLVEDTARIADPDERQLRAFQEANAERYRSEPRLSFQQVFFSPKRRPDALAQASLALAQSAETGTTPEGDPLPLEGAYSRLDPTAMASLFGPSFGEAVVSLKPGRWAGPVKSAYGVHLVLVTAREEGKPRPFDEVRQAVLDDWRRQKARDASEAFLSTLREKYGVVVDATPGALPPRTTAASATP